MVSKKKNLSVLQVASNNFDIIFLILFLFAIVSAYLLSNYWLYIISYGIAILGFVISLTPSRIKELKEDEREVYLKFKSGLASFMTTAVFLMFWYAFQDVIARYYTFEPRNIIITILCFMYVVYTIFHICYKRNG